MTVATKESKYTEVKSSAGAQFEPMLTVVIKAPKGKPTGVVVDRRTEVLGYDYK